jgi:hypothetical protein
MEEKCVICLDTISTTTFKPCGHVVICDNEKCYGHIVSVHGKCPVCREVVDKVILESGTEIKRDDTSSVNDNDAYEWMYDLLIRMDNMDNGFTNPPFSPSFVEVEHDIDDSDDESDDESDDSEYEDDDDVEKRKHSIL